MSAADKAPAARVEGPTELFDLDLGEEHWIRADTCTRSQAKARCMKDLDVDSPLKLGVGKTWAREDVEYAEDAKADGIAEPYDGWPMVLCTEETPGAVAYWHVWRIREPRVRAFADAQAPDGEEEA